MTEKISGVYVIADQTAGKVYIGSSKDLELRSKKHASILKNNKHYNPQLQEAFNAGNKLVTKNFPLKESVIRECEQKLLDKYMDEGITYNVARCPTSPSKGMKATEETKEKMRVAMTGFRHSPETIAKLKEIAKGRPMPPSVIEAARIVNTGRKHTAETIEKVRAASKAHMTPEARAHLGNVNRGIPHTPETILLLKERAIGRNFTPEAREAGRLARERNQLARREKKALELAKEPVV